MGNRFTDERAQAIAELTDVIKQKKAAGHVGDLDQDAMEEKIRTVLAEQKGVGRKGEFDIGDADLNKDLADLRETDGKTHSYEDVVDGAKNAREMSDLLLLGSQMTNQPVRAMKLFGHAKRRFKAMDTATATEGAEWIPTGFSSELVRKVNLQLKVAALFPRINMPTPSFDLPTDAGDLTAYLASESTSDTATKFTASTAGTGKKTFTAVKLAVRSLVSKEVEEDSVVAVLPFVQGKVVKALAEGQEEATLNGDTSTTHQDSDVHALGATDRRKAFIGLRRHALALGTATKDLGTFSMDNLRELRSLMGKYGVDPNQLAWIADIRTYLKSIIALDEVQTMDKYGANATILSGELAKLDGSPLIVSEFQRNTLNASGVYDGSTMTKGALTLVYRPGFMYGDLRSIKVQVLREVSAETDQDAIIATERLDFLDVVDASAETTVALGYDIA